MSKKDWINPRVRRSAAGLAFRSMAMAALAMISLSLGTGCSGGQPVTPEAIAAARNLWAEAGIRDYDLEWTVSGPNNAHYFVTVRDGVVRKVESVAPDGRKFELHSAEPRYFGVDGLFTTIADELAQLQMNQPFGQPKGTKVVMRFAFDPKLGYPRFYRRDVLGTSQGVAIDVIRLIPTGAKARSASITPGDRAISMQPERFLVEEIS
jgi:hypothetical protein